MKIKTKAEFFLNATGTLMSPIDEISDPDPILEPSLKSITPSSTETPPPPTTSSSASNKPPTDGEQT